MSRPKPKVDPSELREQVLQIISGELDLIQEKAKDGKLDMDYTAALVKYSDSLLKYAKNKEEEESEERKKLSKMSTAELAALAEEMAAKAKK